MQLLSSAFSHNDVIPVRFTRRGGNFSPPLEWSQQPPGTKSLAVIVDDPDAPRGRFNHWIIFNLPADCRELKEGVPPQSMVLDGAIQGKNDFGEIGYGGPEPPPGKPHRYFFKLLALDTALDLSPGITDRELRAATNGHVLAEAELMGTYGR
jgi:Raf kinase inhibitor-like YbhB/YbcL family protein